MRPLSCLLVAPLLLTSCLFEAPFVEKASLPIQRGLLGAWDEKTDQDDKSHRLVVLPVSETEYLVHYPATDKGIYYRGYPVEMGGQQYVQLQVLGSHKGLPADLETPYTLARCTREGDSLTIRMIQKDKLDPSSKTSAALREAFLENQKDEGLFGDVGTFEKTPD